MESNILSKIQREILSNGSSEDYSEKLKACTDYDLFYHLSDFRRAIIQWYPFKRDSRILEVNAELGAVTGALCDCAAEVVSLADSDEAKEIISLRYKKRKNLTCILNDRLDAHEKKSFDYIVYIGGLEYFYTESGKLDDVIRRLEDLKAYLRPDGVFLLAVENRYGLTNWLGKRDSFTGIPFDAINDYRFGSDARSFTKTEIEEIIRRCGYRLHKFYYPASDYMNPFCIYTDERLPAGKNDTERISFVPENTDSFISADCMQVYKDVIDAGVFPFFSNSYLVEMTDGNFLAPVQYVSTSLFRGRNRAFFVILDGKKACKKCAFPETADYAGHLCREAEELRERLPVLDMVLKGDRLEMPLIQAPTLQNHIAELAAKRDSDKIFPLLDRLWEYILRSSDYADTCAFDTGNTDVGPILKKAFIELIPLNCFYIDGDFLFFDQEFSRGNCPARYIMARAIVNLYAFIPELSSLISIEDLRSRYGMDEIQWDLFMSVDMDFILSVNSYRYFSIPANPNRIRRNQFALTTPVLLFRSEMIKNLGQYFKHILVYGTGVRAQDLINTLQGKGIVGILDRTRDSGEILGIPVLRWEDIQPGTADAVIIAARPQFHREIYERIAGQCFRLGLAVFLFG